MSGLIDYQALPGWVPGRVLLSSDGLGWKNVNTRAYRYAGQEAVVPAMRDYMLVGYRGGVTPMQRRFDGKWRRETLCPGAASLLTRAQQASWSWGAQIDVVHVYLSAGLVAEVAGEMLDCDGAEVVLNDVLRTDDPVMTHALDTIAGEAQSRGMGGALYVDAVSRGLIVHLLRRYASVRLPEPRAAGGLSATQERRIRGYIEDNLARPMELKEMAALLGMAPCRFSRAFRKSFGRPPYAHVTARRLEAAKRLLARSALPIKAVAADCGFSDQAHLTRMFSAAFGETPAVFRRRAQ
ncbi:helix-turn-helix domain-containing protein [Poseidonocella sp. HB161398]|uniref:helix-turn-helix domain-containing protein n=1 Tax=Poseidonocella sp. HB161398 TaxID=2320855 RepID=UPI001108A715|nr:AraC family transcriptional regulator [Poseidonocella sp. HB161398]